MTAGENRGSMRGRRAQAAIGLALLLLPLALAVAWFAPPSVRVDLRPAQIASETGKAYIVDISQPLSLLYRFEGEGVGRAIGSTMSLFENGVELGPAHTNHQSIREKGGGAYSHWGPALYFSSSDGTDPRTNGYRYRVQGRAELRGSVALIGLGMSMLAVVAAWKLMRIPGRLVAPFGAALVAIGAACLMMISYIEIYDLSLFYPLLTPDSWSFIANNVTRGFFYPTILHVLNLLDPSNRLVVPLQLTFLFASFGLVGWSVARLVQSSLLGAMTTLLLVINTALTGFTLMIMSEALYTGLLCLNMAACLWMLKGRARAAIVAAGVTAALAILVRPAAYSLLPTLLLLAILARLAMRSVLIGLALPIVCLLGVGSLLNWTNQGMFFTQSIGGLSLLGHVLPLANPATDRPPADLQAIYREVTTATAAESTARDALFPVDYWQATSNQYNKLLWGIAAPRMSAYVSQRADQGSRSLFPSGDAVDTNWRYNEINRLSMRLAVSIILDHPFEYVRLVAAHLIGSWVNMFLSYNRLAEGAASLSSNAIIFAEWPSVKEYFGGRYPTEMLDRRLAQKSGDVKMTDRVWREARPLLRGAALILLPILLVAAGAAAWACLRNRALSPELGGLAFCAANLGCYLLLLTSVQAAITRYSTVMEPVLTVALVLCVALLVNGLARFRSGPHLASKSNKSSHRKRPKDSAVN
jgi:hypothetical protein